LINRCDVKAAGGFLIVAADLVTRNRICRIAALIFFDLVLTVIKRVQGLVAVGRPEATHSSIGALDRKGHRAAAVLNLFVLAFVVFGGEGAERCREEEGLVIRSRIEPVLGGDEEADQAADDREEGDYGEDNCCVLHEFEVEAESEPDLAEGGVGLVGVAAAEVAGVDDAAGLPAAVLLDAGCANFMRI
jgi:hypothetical protein